MTKIKKPPSLFPILRFPPEIRNLIWKYTVIAAEAIEIGQHGSQHTRGQLAPSLLRSGKQIHAEDDKRIVPSRLAVAFTCRRKTCPAHWFLVQAVLPCFPRKDKADLEKYNRIVLGSYPNLLFAQLVCYASYLKGDCLKEFPRLCYSHWTGECSLHPKPLP